MNPKNRVVSITVRGALLAMAWAAAASPAATTTTDHRTHDCGSRRRRCSDGTRGRAARRHRGHP